MCFKANCNWNIEDTANETTISGAEVSRASLKARLEQPISRTAKNTQGFGYIVGIFVAAFTLSVLILATGCGREDARSIATAPCYREAGCSCYKTTDAVPDTTLQVCTELK